jgi:hypothetical protein
LLSNPIAGASPERRVTGPRLSVLGTILRRCWPHVVEATVIPAVLFYCCLVFAGLGWAYLSAIGWSYLALARRVVLRKPIPPILVLGLIGITAKTVVAAASGSAFIYFFQPILANIAMAVAFLISVAIGRPLIGRLAHEFWEVTPDMAARPAVRHLFKRLTLFWAAVNMFIATLTLMMLLWLPLAAFVALKQVSALGLRFGAVFVTISVSLSTARREGLIAVPAVVPSDRR